MVRRTIHYWIETGQLDRDLAAGTTRRAPRRRRWNHKLDPYKGIIDDRLREFPKLSTQRLFEEVQAAGYPGGYGRVNDYVRKARPRDPVEPLQRLETPPGRQGQVDFGTFTLPWGRRHALLVVLGHSRLLWLRFFARQTMAVLIDALESAFARFGGVPQELLFDKMRSVVISGDRTGGGIVLNAEFRRFAAHWDFMPRSCRPYRARTKGKVERPIRYLVCQIMRLIDFNLSAPLALCRLPNGVWRRFQDGCHREVTRRPTGRWPPPRSPPLRTDHLLLTY